jgi:hypothetical protein
MNLLALVLCLASSAHGAAALASGVGCGNKSITWDGSSYTCTDFAVADFGASTGTLVSVKASTGTNADITRLNSLNTIANPWTSTSSGTVAAAFTSSTFTLTWAIQLKSLTVAQLKATACADGCAFYCSNCSPKKIVVSTGGSAGNFADAAGGTFK